MINRLLTILKSIDITTEIKDFYFFFQLELIIYSISTASTIFTIVKPKTSEIT